MSASSLCPLVISAFSVTDLLGAPKEMVALPRHFTAALLCVAAVSSILFLDGVGADDPYRFFTWNVTYGDIYPLGVRQQGILIDGQFPGPDIYSVRNDDIIIDVFNNLDEPFLLTC